MNTWNTLIVEWTKTYFTNKLIFILIPGNRNKRKDNSAGLA